MNNSAMQQIYVVLETQFSNINMQYMYKWQLTKIREMNRENGDKSRDQFTHNVNITRGLLRTLT